MKPLTQFVQLGLAATALVLATGCQSVSTSHVQYIGGPRVSPSDPAQVQILRAEPTRAHVRLGEVRAEPYSESMEAAKIEDAIRKEAAKLGADAIVVVRDKTQVMGAMVTGPWWGRSVETIQGRVIIAVAIKYQ
jgi:hypothetical protein